SYIYIICKKTRFSRNELKKGEIFLENDFYKRAGGVYRIQTRKNCAQARSITHKQRKFAAVEVYHAQTTKNCAQTGSIAHKRRKIARRQGLLRTNDGKFARSRGPSHTNEEKLRAVEVHRTQMRKICAQTGSIAQKPLFPTQSLIHCSLSFR